MKRVFLLLVSLFILAAAPIKAATMPDFSTCPNPGGTIVASYSDGIHGIPGDFTTHTGSDSVFQLSDTTYTQCFCPTDPGMGMQTNWWNVSGLTQSEINSFTSSGWILIGNGADWGLTADPYLALNIQRDCNPQAGGAGGGNSNSGSITTVAASTSSSNSQALGTGTGGQVLGLANTGNDKSLIRIIIAVIIASIIFLVLVI